MELPSFADLTELLGLDKHGRPVLSGSHAPRGWIIPSSATQPHTHPAPQPGGTQKIAIAPLTACRPDPPQYKPAVYLALVDAAANMWGSSPTASYPPHMVEVFDAPPLTNVHGAPIAFVVRPVPPGSRVNRAGQLAYTGAPAEWVTQDPGRVRHQHLMCIAALPPVAFDVNPSWRGTVKWRASPLWVKPPAGSVSTSTR
ncbi:hypothetical protein BV25DRAFT_1826129 [Artomyces pyxidatus]|uniref:Uncharacterized protein n=1 Tax=Artomyces pyxidatus TaxID=48021 RepID=A0ACB8SZL1_9AGAM|nr:hypothetical protein BV25DRAFT_1826129 [Artomyces pyxidatus]